MSHAQRRRRLARSPLAAKSTAVKSIIMMAVVVVMLPMMMIATLFTTSHHNICSPSPSVVVVVSAFEFQHDDDPETCQRRVQQCMKDPKTWYECPIACSQKFEREGSMAEERDDPEQFFNFQVVTSKGSTYSIDNNDGYITLFAVLPMMSGVSQYYYDAIEHIRGVYRYTLVSMVYPYQNPKSATMAFIRPAKDAKTISLMSGPPTTTTSPNTETTPDDDANTVTLNYLLSRTIVAGNDRDVELATDRPTIFLISHDGMFIERLVAPTMETIERRIKVYEQAMNFDIDGVKKDL
mmetsp:Transcript_23042/g.54687  ORF Transcript_23042/g.54687 Transcript_23042/m.54687 type:complete len:294 (+) Transcript_23042:127-1008(+)